MGPSAGIECSRYDGSEHRTLVNGLWWPRSLAVDAPTNRLYWVDYKTKEVNTVKTDGRDKRNVLKLSHGKLKLLTNDKIK